MTTSAKADALNKIYRQNQANQHAPLDRKNPGLRAIYAEICHHDPLQKVRLEHIKVTRNQIRQYLRRRYPNIFVGKVIKTFNFAPVSSLDEYCKTIDNFTSSSNDNKCKLGFNIHDTNEDGRICANDVFHIIANNREFEYLGFFDYTVLMDELKRKKPDEIRPPGFMLKDLNTEFMEKWKVKQEEHKQLEEEERAKLSHSVQYEPTIYQSKKGAR